jgi:cyclase
VNLRKRVIACMDVSGGRVVKGREFRDLRDVGDPAELAARYAREGADEIVFLDIAATVGNRGLMLDAVRRAAECLFIPLTVGGGIKTVDDVAAALRAGADKVGINSAAVERPEIITETAERFGAQCVVVSIDARSIDGTSRVFTRGGTNPTPLDAVDWARRCESLGAGEILLTSIDRDGTRHGYDIDLTHAVAAAVGIPVIASGGAGSPGDIVAALTVGGADAALVAGILHDGVVTIAEIKSAMESGGLPVRKVA